MVNRNKTLIGLLVVALGIVYYLQDDNAENNVNRPLLPELNVDASDISKIDKIVINQQSDAIVLSKSSNGWLLNGGFYARMDTLFTWIQALKNAQIIELKTTDADHFLQLQLTDNYLRVRLYQAGELITDLILGQEGSVLNSRFVRRFDTQQTMLASHLKGLSAAMDIWPLSILFDYDKKCVVALKVTTMDGFTLDLLRNPETGVWQVDNETAVTLNQEKMDKLTAGLADFTITKAEPKSDKPKTMVSRLEYGLNDGNKVTLTIYEHVLELTDSQQPDRYINWQFTLPNAKFNDLTVKKSELLVPLAKGATVGTMPTKLTTISLSNIH